MLIILAESVDPGLTILQLVEPLLILGGDRHGLCLIIARRFRLILQGGKVTDHADYMLAIIVSGHALPKGCLDRFQLLVKVTTQMLHAGWKDQILSGAALVQGIMATPV